MKAEKLAPTQDASPAATQAKQEHSFSRFTLQYFVLPGLSYLIKPYSIYESLKISLVTSGFWFCYSSLLLLYFTFTTWINCKKNRINVDKLIALKTQKLTSFLFVLKQQVIQSQKYNEKSSLHLQFPFQKLCNSVLWEYENRVMEIRLLSVKYQK